MPSLPPSKSWPAHHSHSSSLLIQHYISSVDKSAAGIPDKSDGIMDNIRLVFRFPGREGGREIFSVPKGPERLWGQTSRLLNVYKWLFLRKWSGRAVITLATDLQLNPAISGAVSPRPHTPSWRANGRIGLYFTFNGMEQLLKNLSQVNM